MTVGRESRHGRAVPADDCLVRRGQPRQCRDVGNAGERGDGREVGIKRLRSPCADDLDCRPCADVNDIVVSVLILSVFMGRIGEKFNDLETESLTDLRH